MTQKITINDIEIEIEGQIADLTIKDKKISIKVTPQVHNYPYNTYPPYVYPNLKYPTYTNPNITEEPFKITWTNPVTWQPTYQNNQSGYISYSNNVLTDGHTITC